MSQKYLITIIVFLFIASAAFLFWQNARALDPDQGKSWWTLSFASPEKAESLSFIVENHSDQADFQYEVTVDKTLVVRDVFTLRRGEKKTILPTLDAVVSGRTKVTVTLGIEKKEIYR